MHNELLIAGLRKQQEILEDLIARLSGHAPLTQTDCALYDLLTTRVEKNLTTLRKTLTDEIQKALPNEN